MKIEYLHFENLASFAGEWSIDFTDPELARTGVFLIQAVTARDATTTQAEFKTPESKFQTFVSPHVQNSHQKCLLSTRKPKGTG